MFEPKITTTIYLEGENANGGKVIQDATSQIRALSFSKNNLHLFDEVEYSTNNSVYFLFGRRKDNSKLIYVGQSRNGIDRIKNHRLKKDFWDTGILFLTENNSLNLVMIDYLEYHFINEIGLNGMASLTNTDLRTKEPKLSLTDKTLVRSHLRDIEFLMKVEGVHDFIYKDEQTIYINDNLGTIPTYHKLDQIYGCDDTNDEGFENNANMAVNIKEAFAFSDKTRYFYPLQNNYIAKLMISEGNMYIQERSRIQYPNLISRNTTEFSEELKSLINSLESKGSIQEKSQGIFQAMEDIPVDDPLLAAQLVSGEEHHENNGIYFWKYLDEFLEKNEDENED